MNHEDEIMDGMLRWEPGDLPTHTLERILMDALSDLWRDCYRRDNANARERLFTEKLRHLTSAATNGTINLEGR